MNTLQSPNFHTGEEEDKPQSVKQAVAALLIAGGALALSGCDYDNTEPIPNDTNSTEVCGDQEGCDYTVLCPADTPIEPPYKDV